MMIRADRLRASTTKVTQLLRRSGKCSCGHQKAYHINGSENCVFGICPCRNFAKREAV